MQLPQTHKAQPAQVRRKTAERGYDAAHQRLRIQCFERDGFRCLVCGWEPEVVQAFREANLPLPPTGEILDFLRREFAAKRRHLHADHEIPIEKRPDLRLDLDNLKTMCSVCHGGKTRRERVG